MDTNLWKNDEKKREFSSFLGIRYSAKLAEYSAEWFRSNLAEYSAEYSVFGRTLIISIRYIKYSLLLAFH